jgi:hypothetical protein
MKQHSGEEIRAIMADMPAGQIEDLQAAHAEHKITEYEARWWGYLMFARTGAYEGTEFTIKVMGDGEDVTQGFLSYVLAERAGNARHGLIRRPWPQSGLDRAGDQGGGSV